MKLTTQRMLGFQSSCLRAFVVILYFVLAATAGLAQESTQVDEATKPVEALADSAKPAPAKPAADTERPNAIQALMPSIVTVTRVEPAGGDVVTKPVSHSGIVVDPRGYIVTPFVPSQSRPKFFVVRFSNDQEFMGEAAAIDESLKLVVLKIERPQPVAAVSLAKIRAARVGDRVRLVPSPASKGKLFGGRVTSTTIDLAEDGLTKLIQTDVAFPLSEYGNLIVSELGEPLGVLIASRTSPQPTSLVLPMKAVQPLIKAATDKPQDVPVVTVPASPPPVDLRKSPQVELLLKSGIGSFDPRAKPFTDYGTPVQISLQPATPLAKLLVEHFGQRGARVLDYEEGKRLKIEALPHVLVELGGLLEEVFREPQKPESKDEFDEPATTPSVPVPASTGIPNTPAAKQLVEQLVAQESAAAAEAATIRQLQANGQAEQNRQPIDEHQRKLKNLLSTAFDLKLQWEELQVKELQSRLSRLERQIGQRKELREKIINRRAGELIEGDALRWDSTGAFAAKTVGNSATSKPNARQSNSVAASRLTTQIHFTGPHGMKVLIAGEPWELIAPGRHNFVRHTSETQRYDLGFMDPPDRQFGALLDIFPSTPDTEEFLNHNGVPITLTDEETRQASTELLIKVIYLHKPSNVKAAIPEVKTLLSTDFNAKVDVIAAANEFGAILAVLRLAKNVDQLGKLDPKSSNAAITRPRPASQEGAKDEVAERSTSSQPSYQEFAKKLGTMNSSVAEAEEKLKRAEIRVKSGLELTEVATNARRQVDEAIRNRKAIQDEYAAVLRDLELQIESAQIEVDAAKPATFASGSQKDTEAAEHRLRQAKLTLERLKVRYDLYKKAGGSLTVGDKQ